MITRLFKWLMLMLRSGVMVLYWGTINLLFWGVVYKSVYEVSSRTALALVLLGSLVGTLMLALGLLFSSWIFINRLIGRDPFEGEDIAKGSSEYPGAVNRQVFLERNSR